MLFSDDAGAGSAAGNGAGSAAGNAGSGNSQTPQGNQQGNQETKQAVSYDSYQKLLDQKKAMDRKLEQFEAQQKENETKQKLEKEQFKTLYEETKKQHDDLQNKFNGLRKDRVEDYKISAFIGKLPAPLVNDQYVAHAHLNEIIYDEETGTVNDDSVKRVVDSFLKEHPGLLKQGNRNSLPNDAPGGNAAKLSYDDWLKLPTKEKAKRMKDVTD